MEIGVKAVKVAQVKGFSKVFRGFVSIINKAYYRRIQYIGLENIPRDGNPVVLAGNHQNCMMDPLNVEAALSDRKPYCLTRGDVFKINGIITRFLYWLGLLPVTRASFDGVSITKSKESNKSTFSKAEEYLGNGNTLIIFPEAAHQDKRWLGYFSLAYLTMSFQTAEKFNFSKEIYVVPFAHHYANYFHPFYDFLLQFGTPIALSQYYELYKTKPRTAMREVNEKVEKQIRSMMLDITDLDHYAGIDQLRTGPFGAEFARKCGFDPEDLSEKLKADKKLVAGLEAASASEPEKTKSLLDRLQSLETKIMENGMRDWVVAEKPGKKELALRILALVVLLPLFGLSVAVTWPALLIPYLLGKIKVNGKGDLLFQSTWQFGTTVLITAPLLWILPALILLFSGAIFKALAFFIAYPLLLTFAVKYKMFFVKTKGVWRYVTGGNSEKLSDERRAIIEEIDKTLS